MNNSAQGFTLIEVMVALAVVSIGLMACLKAVNQEVGAVNFTHNKMLALWILENKVAEIRTNPVLPSNGMNQGQQILFNQTWHWQTNTTHSGNAKIRKVEVSVFSDADKDKQNPVITQSIYLADLK